MFRAEPREEPDYYSHPVPINSAKNRMLQRDMLELQARREKSFMDKMMNHHHSHVR